MPTQFKPKRKSVERYVHPAKGIRHKILYGFIILACLLFFSGLVSFFELSRLSRTVERLPESTFTAPTVGPTLDSLFRAEPLYREAYDSLALSAQEQMTESRQAIRNRLERVHDNAYRALMPGIITLAIAILIILVFYFMIDYYYIRPVLKVNKGLNNFLENKMPYQAKIEGRDEVKELSDQVETLVNMVRKKETNG